MVCAAWTLCASWLVCLQSAPAPSQPSAASRPALPEVELQFSTYLGGASYDSIRDVCCDAQGNLYVTGGTQSPDFPTTAGAWSRTHAGWMDVFVTKLSPEGRILWSTLLGGPQYDRAYAIELARDGTLCLAGRAGPGFPVTGGAFQKEFRGSSGGPLYGEQDAFVARLSADGGRLLWASYFGTAHGIRDLDLDAEDHFVVGAGWDTVGRQLPYPEDWFRAGFQPKVAGKQDTVVASLRGDGTGVRWATCLGGSGVESGAPSVRVAADGSVWVYTVTDSADVKLPAGGAQPRQGGASDALVARIAADGTRLLAATYLGGSRGEADGTHQLALGPDGSAFVSGVTYSEDFPATAGALQKDLQRKRDGAWEETGDLFVARLSRDCQLLAATLYGGSKAEGMEGMAVDRDGRVWVSGFTYSSDAPLSASALQRAYRGKRDTLALCLTPALDRLLFATLLGGTGEDSFRAVAVDPLGGVVLAGMVQSRDWPWVHALRTTCAGQDDGVVVRLRVR